MKKKVLVALASVACALLLVVGSIAGTMAYLTSTAEVTNTFTVGNVTIDMDETDVTVYGEKESETRVKENIYKLIPGHTYIKDPTITVSADSEDCYLFFKLENGLGTAATFNIDSTKWLPVTNQTDVYYYTNVATADVATAGTQIAAFTTMTIKTDADVASLGTKEVKVTAYAVQADSFANATAAWNATFGDPNP